MIMMLISWALMMVAWGLLFCLWKDELKED